MAINILLRTATVQPPQGAIGLVRTDVNLRKRDYLEAMAFYLGEIERGTFEKIVLVDNSNTPLDFLQELVDARGAGDNVELISYDGLDYPPEDGRTYGEFKLIDDAYRLSRVLQAVDDDDIVWKITGRYTVHNIDKLASRRPRGADLYCNARTIPSKYLDLYCISWNGRGYRKFIQGIYPRLNVCNTTVPGENLFFDILFDGKAAADIEVKPRFNVTPFITGVRGFTNTGFNVGKDRRKFYLRVALRRVAPWIWV